MYGESQYQSPSRFCRELGLLGLEQGTSLRSQNDFTASHRLASQMNGYNRPYKTYDGGVNIFDHTNFFKKEKKEESPVKDVSIYKVGQKVSHPRFGQGEIVSITPDGLVGDIVFDGVGKKSLMLELAPLEILEG